VPVGERYPPPSGAAPLTARGHRVHVRPVALADVANYRSAFADSKDRIGRWNPVDRHRITTDLGQQGPTARTFMVLAHDPRGAHGLVGRVNVSNVVLGTFRSATMGYDAYDPYAGQGLFREGLGLVVGVALAAESSGGMGLHRVEANVQPGNTRSAGVLRALGFRHEGRTPRMLLLPASDGADGLRWRDHERYAVTAEEWPARPYAPHDRPRPVVLVTGGPGRLPLARALAAELVLPLLAEHLAGPTAWALLAGCPQGAVLEGGWTMANAAVVTEGLADGRADPASVVEVCCWSTSTPDRVDPGQVATRPSGLGLAPVLAVEVGASVSPTEVTRIALTARALAADAATVQDPP
jgi:[ribosomal protein S5]-alanine N-acetyltransferase